MNLKSYLSQEFSSERLRVSLKPDGEMETSYVFPYSYIHPYPLEGDYRLVHRLENKDRNWLSRTAPVREIITLEAHGPHSSFLNIWKLEIEESEEELPEAVFPLYMLIDKKMDKHILPLVEKVRGEIFPVWNYYRDLLGVPREGLTEWVAYYPMDKGIRAVIRSSCLTMEIALENPYKEHGKWRHNIQPSVEIEPFLGDKRNHLLQEDLSIPSILGGLTNSLARHLDFNLPQRKKHEEG